MPFTTPGRAPVEAGVGVRLRCAHGRTLDPCDDLMKGRTQTRRRTLRDVQLTLTRPFNQALV